MTRYQCIFAISDQFEISLDDWLGRLKYWRDSEKAYISQYQTPQTVFISETAGWIALSPSTFIFIVLSYDTAFLKRLFKDIVNAPMISKQDIHLMYDKF